MYIFKQYNSIFIFKGRFITVNKYYCYDTGFAILSLNTCQNIIELQAEGNIMKKVTASLCGNNECAAFNGFPVAFGSKQPHCVVKTKHTYDTVQQWEPSRFSKSSSDSPTVLVTNLYFT